MLGPGFIADRVDANVAEPSDAPGIAPGKADLFASDRLAPPMANLWNTTSLSVSATLSYMDHQSQLSIDQGLVRVCSSVV
jgi:hypothetical protein